MPDGEDVIGPVGRQPSFGLRGLPAPNPSARTQQCFGRRSAPPGLSVSLQEARLRELYVGLRLVLEDPAYPDHPVAIELTASPDPHMQIGHSVRVSIDASTGRYAAKDLCGTTGDTFISADLDRVTEYVLAQLAREGAPRSEPVYLDTVSVLVGRPMAYLEKAFILSTLRHCNGNRTHTARILGISLRTLRNKLREYFRPSDTGKE